MAESTQCKLKGLSRKCHECQTVKNERWRTVRAYKEEGSLSEKVILTSHDVLGGFAGGGNSYQPALSLHV